MFGSESGTRAARHLILPRQRGTRHGVGDSAGDLVSPVGARRIVVRGIAVGQFLRTIPRVVMAAVRRKSSNCERLQTPSQRLLQCGEL
jgi:hypothetical protein